MQHLCFFFKEHLKESEDTPLTTYYTDRQGLPVCIDITGKEGKKKMTDNANFFCIGPSGTGKSFHMNSVVRQLSGAEDRMWSWSIRVIPTKVSADTTRVHT